MRKILITGGAGFVGRHFCRHFLEAGDEVHCVDSIVPLTGGIDVLRAWPLFEPRDFSNFHFYKEDCRDYFRRVLKQMPNDDGTWLTRVLAAFPDVRRAQRFLPSGPSPCPVGSGQMPDPINYTRIIYILPALIQRRR